MTEILICWSWGSEEGLSLFLFFKILKCLPYVSRPSRCYIIVSSLDENSNLIHSVNSYLESAVCWRLLVREDEHLTSFKKVRFTLVSVAQLIGVLSHNQTGGSAPHPGAYDPWAGCVQGQPVDVFLSH